MNDPHVVSLTYRIEMADTVDFDHAPPRTVDRGAFRVTLDAGEATVEMADHFASVEEARQVVDPFLRLWEFATDLRDASDRFRFVYKTAKIIDRNPSPPGHVVVSACGTSIAFASATATAHVRRGRWPDPPDDLAISPDVDALWRRWWRYREEKQEGLLSAAYWALTMVVAAPGPGHGRNQRQRASEFFNIEPMVLRKIGELTSTRGGDDESRKAEGRAAPLSPAERRWLEAAFRALLRRVAEQAYHGRPPPTPLRMSDLPKLTT